MHTKFIAARFILAKTWKQPKCLVTDEEEVTDVHTHTHTHTKEYYSVIKRMKRHLHQHGWT